jgi:hypothetical protein
LKEAPVNAEQRPLVISLVAWIAMPLLGLALPAPDAGAKSRRNAADNATWRAECGSCHVPFPPALLPAGEWSALMGGLDRHFGVDASIDAKAAAEISAFLAANAGRGEARAAGAEPRITTTRWFRHEHGKLAAATFAAPGVKTAANCAACHPGAAKGDFDEHAVRIPR